MNALERFHGTGSADEWSTILSMGPFKQPAVDADGSTSNTIISQQSNEHYYLRH
jgi:hypothetical protein